LSESVKARRAYDATRRVEAARQSRRTVLETAQRLFLDRGFAATTMSDIAAGAGVSTKNLYKVFGNKVGLAKAVFDVAIAGDDEPVPMVERASLMKVRDAPDPRRKLILYGEHLATVAPRHVPLQLVILDAAANDPDAAQVWDDLQAERLRGMTMFAKALAEEGHLRHGVSAAEARDVLWTYNSAELYRLLVIERRWSVRRYGGWVASALTAALLPSEPPDG
jgi:AcrR family transcriptional regulator